LAPSAASSAAKSALIVAGAMAASALNAGRLFFWSSAWICCSSLISASFSLALSAFSAVR
jgi:hypothetical protein